MQWLRQALSRLCAGSDASLANLTALDEENRELVNQILGEGEVSISYNGAIRARSQESVLAGVWRTLYFNDEDRVCYDILEVADVPHTVRMPDGLQRPLSMSTEPTFRPSSTTRLRSWSSSKRSFEALPKKVRRIPLT